MPFNDSPYVIKTDDPVLGDGSVSGGTVALSAAQNPANLPHKDIHNNTIYLNNTKFPYSGGTITGDTQFNTFASFTNNNGLKGNSSGTLLIRLKEAVGDINNISISSSPASSGPIIASEGTDTNVDINIGTKGTGRIKIQGDSLELGNNFPTSLYSQSANNDPKIAFNLVLDSLQTSWLYGAGLASDYGNVITSDSTSGNLDFWSTNTSGNSGTTATVYKSLSIAHLDNAVNYIEINPSLVGLPIGFKAQGSDTNIDINLVPKGSGKIGVGNIVPTADLDVSSHSSLSRIGLKIGDETPLYVNYADLFLGFNSYQGLTASKYGDFPSGSLWGGWLRYISGNGTFQFVSSPGPGTAGSSFTGQRIFKISPLIPSPILGGENWLTVTQGDSGASPRTPIRLYPGSGLDGDIDIFSSGTTGVIYLSNSSRISILNNVWESNIGNSPANTDLFVSVIGSGTVTIIVDGVTRSQGSLGAQCIVPKGATWSVTGATTINVLPFGKNQ